MQVVSDTIAALPDFNNFEHHEGFEAFDVNIDDKISMEDLRSASQRFDLGIHEDDLQGKKRKEEAPFNSLMTIKTFFIETFLKRSDSRSFTEWFRVVNTLT